MPPTVDEKPVRITKHPTRPKTYQIHAEQLLPRPLDEVFAFFCDPFQLEKITPSWLKFHVQTPGPIPMKPGTLIDYRLKVRGIPLRWRSEISVWEPPYRFVDEQRIGPYRMWYHEHSFEEAGRNTRVIDRVDYQVPGGALINWLFVQGDLQRVFEYRHKVLAQEFAE